jgi:hypothetical protein
LIRVDGGHHNWDSWRNSFNNNKKGGPGETGLKNPLGKSFDCCYTCRRPYMQSTCFSVLTLPPN